MRTYAVRLEPGRYGPEFNSIPEASRWGFENLGLDDTTLSVIVAYMRDGKEIQNCTVTRICEPLVEGTAPPDTAS